jgi:hypothetical protein
LTMGGLSYASAKGAAMRRIERTTAGHPKNLICS